LQKLSAPSGSAKASRDLLPELRHPQIALALVVRQRDPKVAAEPQDLCLVVTEGDGKVEALPLQLGALHAPPKERVGLAAMASSTILS